MTWSPLMTMGPTSIEIDNDDRNVSVGPRSEKRPGRASCAAPMISATPIVATVKISRDRDQKRCTTTSSITAPVAIATARPARSATAYGAPQPATSRTATADARPPMATCEKLMMRAAR